RCATCSRSTARKPSSCSIAKGVTYQCGLNVLPVSISVLRRERMRGQPSAQEAYAASSSAHWSWVTETWVASLSGTSSIVTREVLLEEPMANVYCKELGASDRST